MKLVILFTGRLLCGDARMVCDNFYSVHEVLCTKGKLDLNEPQSRCKSMSNNGTFKTAGGRIKCIQCSAKSKRTGQQCLAPALKGKTKCRFHGGSSTGPKTQEGLQRCAEARTIHGRETTSLRMERSLASAQLAVLESVGFSLGVMTGTRTVGRRPNRMEDAFPELKSLYHKLVNESAKQGTQ